MALFYFITPPLANNGNPEKELKGKELYEEFSYYCYNFYSLCEKI